MRLKLYLPVHVTISIEAVQALAFCMYVSKNYYYNKIMLNCKST